MKYTTKDICKIWNMNRETLRFYEKKGLIHPEIDEENNYRYYDDWDINYLGECKKYRSLGYSIEEIDEIFKKDDLQAYIDKTVSKQNDFQQKIEHYQKLYEKNADDIKALENIGSCLNRCSIKIPEVRYFIPFRQNFEQIFSEDVLNLMPIITANYAFIENTVFIPQSDYETGSGNFMWGFSISKKWVDRLAFPVEKMQLLSFKKSIYTIIDAGERWNFGYHLWEHANYYLLKNSLSLDGPIYGNLLTRITEDDGYHRYIELTIPVQ